MAILNDNEFTEVEGRSYVNPQVALDESNAFIDNLRSTQQANNQQIQTDTYNLGTAIPSNLGSLTGSESYFTSRYQVPQTASAVANLRATAQASALSQALENEQEFWKKRYNDAYRAYQKRGWNKSSGGNVGGSDEGDVSEEETTREVGTVTTEQISRNMYMRKMQEYINKGMSAVEAEARAKADMGIATIVNNEDTARANKITRERFPFGGNESMYVYTLPNGKKVPTDESRFDLIVTSTGYVLRERSTGETKQVGV